MKYLMALLFIITSTALFGQKKITVEAVFDAAAAHKDGYEVNGYIVDIPFEIAQKCDKKKVKLEGAPIAYHVTKEDLEYKNVKGETEYKQGREGDYTVFVLESLSVWDAKSGTWMLAYKPKKP